MLLRCYNIGSVFKIQHYSIRHNRNAYKYAAYLCELQCHFKVIQCRAEHRQISKIQFKNPCQLSISINYRKCLPYCTCTLYSYRLDVCPSVCPSHAVIVSKRLINNVKLYSLLSVDQIFFPEFQWEHPNGGVKCKGVGKRFNFRPISRSLVNGRRWVLPCV